MAKSTAAVPKKMAKTAANSSSALHPPYFQMVTEAISTLKERTGSSQPAIAKLMEDKYKAALPPNFKKILSVQLKKLVKSDKLVKVKNSYKISSAEKLKPAVKEKPKAKNPTAAAAAAKKGTIPKKISEKGGGVKTKRLSQVKTPEALKNQKKKKDPKSAKSASLVKKAKNLTPMKRKSLKKPVKKASK